MNDECDAHDIPVPDGGDDGDERQAKQRARYLDRTTALRRREALALAYRELGYSHAAIARRIGFTKSTVDDYMATVTARFGPAATMTKTAAERDDLNPVSLKDVDSWPDHFREWWADALEQQLDAVPDAVDPEEVLPNDG